MIFIVGREIDNHDLPKQYPECLYTSRQRRLNAARDGLTRAGDALA